MIKFHTNDWSLHAYKLGNALVRLQIELEFKPYSIYEINGFAFSIF